MVGTGCTEESRALLTRQTQSLIACVAKMALGL